MSNDESESESASVLLALTLGFGILLVCTILFCVIWWMTGWLCCFCKYNPSRKIKRRSRHRKSTSGDVIVPVYLSYESGVHVQPSPTATTISQRPSTIHNYFTHNISRPRESDKNPIIKHEDARENYYVNNI